MQFSITNNQVYILKSSALITHKLDSAIYRLCIDAFENLYLSKESNIFKLPDNIYSDFDYASLFINKFVKNSESSEPRNLGILLSGEKGSGKSLLAKRVCNSAISELDIPVIIIDSSFDSSKVASLISSLDFNCVILFDEFDKNYHNTENWDRGASTPFDQNKLLSVFNGTDNLANKMFILTVNSTTKVNSLFLNRPSRIHYKLNFSKLSNSIISAYLSDNLIPERLNDIPVIEELLSQIQTINFDLLQSVVEELNFQTTSSVSDILKMLNIDKDSTFTEYYATLVHNGIHVYTTIVTLNFGRDKYVNIYFNSDEINRYLTSIGQNKVENVVRCNSDIEPPLDSSSMSSQYTINLTKYTKVDDTLVYTVGTLDNMPLTIELRQVDNNTLF
jgi:hypothetical protein